MSDTAADKLLLERAIMNVIGNAIDHSPPKGTVYVEVQKPWKHLCCTTAFFLLPSCGRLHFYLFTYMLNANFVDFIKIYFMGNKSRTSNMHFGMGLYITSSIIKQHKSIFPWMTVKGVFKSWASAAICSFCNCSALHCFSKDDFKLFFISEKEHNTSSNSLIFECPTGVCPVWKDKRKPQQAVSVCYPWKWICGASILHWLTVYIQWCWLFYSHLYPIPQTVAIGWISNLLNFARIFLIWVEIVELSLSPAKLKTAS